MACEGRVEKIRPFAKPIDERVAMLTESILFIVFVSNASVFAAFPWLALQAFALGSVTGVREENREQVEPRRSVASSQAVLLSNEKAKPAGNIWHEHRAVEKQQFVNPKGAA